ncbi:MAG: dnaX [Frankiales bacterium]|nr:dnaX [Frankiales bacterium]
MALALYRKYRPGSFAEVKGQEHVTGPLRQALTNGRIHHAFLFSGPRGCGKTSSARILARSLNCAEGPTPDPCGVCDSCVALAPNGPGALDVIEIDAASHNGVDDARDLREKAFFAPVRDRFKVYIVDEAHMVTPAAFNALLKLVEEPPEFVKYVFATTEPEKVLQTIRSRTHHYPFRLMPRKDLTTLLTEIVDAEGVLVDKEHVLPLVVRAAQGSARDGLSILDQVIASAGPEGVTREAAAGLLGVTPDVLLDDVLDSFSVGDAAAVFATVDAVMEGGHDPRRFAADVLERLRDLVILDAVPDAAEKGVLDCPPEQLERMRRQASALGAAGLSRAADLFHDGLTEMRGTTAPRLLLELVCARVLLPGAAGDTSESAVLARVERLERRFEIGAPAAPPAAPAYARSAGARTPQPVRTEPPVAPLTAPTGERPPPAERPAPASAGAAAGERPHAEPARPVATERPAAAAQPAGLPASGSTDWPEAATPGAPLRTRTPPDSTPAGAGSPPSRLAPATPSADAAATGIDAAAIRRAWDTVLEHVKQRKRVTHARLLDTQVAAVSEGRLALSFTTPTLARQFQEGVNVDFLREALVAVLGADLGVDCISGAGGAAPDQATSAQGRRPAVGSSSAAPAAPAAPPVRPYEGFAPGDEAADEPDEPDVPGQPPPRRETGDEAALRLVQQALGGQVMHSTDD